MIQQPEKYYQPYPARVEAVVRILDSVMGRKEYTDKALERYFKATKKAGSDDRAFISEMVYDAVRHWNYLVWFTGDRFSFKRDGLWLLVGNLLFLKGYELPPWHEFASINQAKAKEKTNRKNLPRYILQSVSQDLDALAIEQLGEDKWNEELAEMNIPASVILRTNLLKTTRKELSEAFEKEGIITEFIADYPEALRLKARANVFRSPLFEKGFFEVQDAGSQRIAPFLQVKPGMRVIDACAGAGGKSLHLATLMQNKGRLVAMDVEAFKLDELKNRAQRNGINIIETRPIEGMKSIKRLENSADRLLLDVPCTGSGVLKRNPDAKFKIDRAFFERVKATQKDILQNYAAMLKTDGVLVYATCSVFSGENEEQVNQFISENPSFQLEESYMHYPSQTHFDGFYMARIRKLS